MQLTIHTFYGIFRRTAWTGGDTPTPEFRLSGVGLQLIQFFMNEQIADCGGMDNIKNWLFGDQTVEDKLKIFRNRANYDAWATFRAGELLTTAKQSV